MLLIVSMRRPDVEADTAEVDRPDDVRDIGRDERIGGGAIGRTDNCGLQPLRARLRNALLEEGRAAGSVRIALEQNWAALHGAHQLLLHGLVIAHQVELRLAPFGKEHLAGAGDRDFVPGRLDRNWRFSHGLSRYYRPR